MIENSSFAIKDLYKAMGINPVQVVVGGEIKNIFKVLNFEPKFDDKGQRMLTPYEILGVPPQIENGKERPIVFAIKNRVRRIGRYDGSQLHFVYKTGKVKEEKSLLSALKTSYRRAVFQGNEEQAHSILESIEALTGQRAKDVVGSVYDYNKYYKKMKKQLMIDMFAHFFLMYIRASIKSVKKGLIYKNKIYKPFKDDAKAYLQGTNELGETEFVPIMDPVSFGLGNMQKIVVNDNEGNVLNDISFAGNTQTSKSVGLNVDSKSQDSEVKEYKNLEKLNQQQSVEQNIEQKQESASETSVLQKTFIKKKKKLKSKRLFGNAKKQSNDTDFEQEDIKTKNQGYGFEV